MSTIKKQFLGLVAWLVVCFSASAVGAIASIQAKSFYGQLVQPFWAPPGWLFGPVWTILFGLMAVSVWLVWCSGGFRANVAVLVFFLIHLAVNALWSWLFFAWKLGAIAFANIVLLWLFIAVLVVCFIRIRLLAGLLLMPYLFWVGFALFLNYSLLKLNPLLLG